jgi:hypothetical protein
MPSFQYFVRLEFWASHSSVVEDFFLLEYDAASLCNRFPTFWGDVLSSAKVLKSEKTSDF